MKIRAHLIAAMIATLLIPQGQVLAGDFGDGRPPRLSKQAAERLHRYWSLREAVAACESRRSFETVWDENSDFDPAIGCSSRANLAAMVSRRRDLVMGRGARYHDAERASNIVRQYRAWQAPGGSSADHGNHGAH